MKNKQQEVGVILPPTDIQEDTRTYEQLCKDARNAIERSAKDWIPRFCNALKRQYPLLKFTEIKNKVIDDWSRLWKPKTISDSFPDWIKNPKNVASGTKAGAASAASTKRRRSESTESQQQQQPESKSTEQQQRIRDEQKHDTLIDDICGYLMGTAELITGYKEEQILQLNDNLKLISETKQFRFQLVKKLSELQIGIVYRDARRAAMVLNDFQKQLDDELDSRKRKENLTSE